MTIMSLVKIFRIDFFLSMMQSHSSQSFTFRSLTIQIGKQNINIQANSTNYSLLSHSSSLSPSPSLFLSLSLVRIRSNSPPRSRSIDGGGSDRESSIAFFVHDVIAHPLMC